MLWVIRLVPILPLEGVLGVTGNRLILLFWFEDVLVFLVRTVFTRKKSPWAPSKWVFMLSGRTYGCSAPYWHHAIWAHHQLCWTRGPSLDYLSMCITPLCFKMSLLRWDAGCCSCTNRRSQKPSGWGTLKGTWFLDFTETVHSQNSILLVFKNVNFDKTVLFINVMRLWW